MLLRSRQLSNDDSIVEHDQICSECSYKYYCLTDQALEHVIPNCRPIGLKIGSFANRCWQLFLIARYWALTYFTRQDIGMRIKSPASLESYFYSGGISDLVHGVIGMPRTCGSVSGWRLISKFGGYKDFPLSQVLALSDWISVPSAHPPHPVVGAPQRNRQSQRNRHFLPFLH